MTPPRHNVFHLAIGVRDLDRALVFYRDVLGIEVRFDESEVMPATGNTPELRRRGAYLATGPDPTSFVVLDEHAGARGEPSEMFQIGVHHIGLWITDLDGVLARAAAHGIEPFLGPYDSHPRNTPAEAGRLNMGWATSPADRRAA